MDGAGVSDGTLGVAAVLLPSVGTTTLDVPVGGAGALEFPGTEAEMPSEEDGARVGKEEEDRERVRVRVRVRERERERDRL